MYDVITIGSVTRDVFLQSALFKKFHDPKHLERMGFKTGDAECLPFGAKIEIEKPSFMVGGGAANAAVTFARQGFKTAAIAKVGNDYVGTKAVEALHQEKIQVYPSFDKKGTAWSAILLSATGERTILNYRGASEDFQKSDMPKNLKSRWLYVVPGSIDHNLIFSLIQNFKKQGTKIAVDFSKHYLDLGPKKLGSILELLDVVHINREEASVLTGKKYEDEAGIFRNLERLIPGIVLMTDGPKGVIASDGRQMYRSGVYKEKRIADRTGAGDAFGSGFVAMLAGKKLDHNGVYAEKDIERAIRFASANATSVVEVIGTEPGILRKGQFEREARWRHLAIKIQKL